MARKNYAKAFNALLLSCVDNSGYNDSQENTLTTDKEKIKFLIATFKKEYGFQIQRIGAYKAAREYLQGLPSVCTIPFWNCEIIDFMANIEYNRAKNNDLVVDHYWDRMANELCKLYFKAH